MTMTDPDHPAYSDDAIGEDVERCGHGVSFDEHCDDCEDEDNDDFDDEDDFPVEEL